MILLEITFDEFKKLDIRIGKIKEAEQVPKSRNLIKIIVDFGFEKRQCVAGLLNYYEPKDLVDKKFVFLMNLEQRKPKTVFLQKPYQPSAGTGYPQSEFFPIRVPTGKAQHANF